MTGELPSGYLLRRPLDQDAEAVLALMVACDLEMLGEPDSTIDDVKAEWTLPRFDKARDAWVVTTESGDIVGYAWVWDRVPRQDLQADLRVHPERRGLGIEEVLVRLLEERGREHFDPTSPERDLTIALFTDSKENLPRILQAHGYRSVRTFHRMRIDLAEPVAAPAIPEGIEIRPYRQDVDGRSMHRAVEEAFEGHFRFAPEPHEEWLSRRVTQAGFDPALWHIAWDGEEPAGGVISYVFGDLGWIRELGVRSAWRGRGIGKALLLQAFRGLEGKGMKRISLGVDSANATGATRLYDGVGMRVELQNDLYQKSIRPPR